MHHVLLESGSNLEHFTTLVALELLDVSVVQLTVLPQVALLAEAQAAGLANEGLLSRVGPHVRGEDLSRRELLFAKLAFETENVRKFDVSIPQTVRSESVRGQRHMIKPDKTIEGFGSGLESYLGLKSTRFDPFFLLPAINYSESLSL